MPAGDCPAIYAISINKKWYIGSAISWQKRKAKHIKMLRTNNHANKHLQYAYNKYQDFSFIVLQTCGISELLELEQKAIAYYDVVNKGYNKRFVPNSNIGLKFSEETRAKMSVAQKGHSRLKGCTISEEHKSKVSVALKGRKHSTSHIEKRIAHKRKPEKWHNGYNCPCRACKTQRSQDIMAARAKRKSMIISCEVTI